MKILPVGPMLDPSVRVLQLPLGQFAAPAEMLTGGDGLPAGAVYLPSANLALASTPCAMPMFEKVALDVCERRRCDVLLQRTGLYPETLDPVTVEVALIMDQMAALVPGLIYMRHRNGSLWLVPQQVGPYIEVSENGLAISSVPPFVTWDERTDGVCRAAAEIVRLVHRRGH